MDQRITSINRLLKGYDQKLYAKRASTGMVQVYRNSVRWESHYLGDCVLRYARPNPHLIFCLTDNWNITGRPVEWGLEPVYGRLQAIDNHTRSESVLDEIERRENQLEAMEARARSNEFKAVAADMRRDFAKATNDINTSTITKIDNRRKKGA